MGAGPARRHALQVCREEDEGDDVSPLKVGFQVCCRAVSKSFAVDRKRSEQQVHPANRSPHKLYSGRAWRGCGGPHGVAEHCGYDLCTSHKNLCSVSKKPWLTGG